MKIEEITYKIEFTDKEIQEILMFLGLSHIKLGSIGIGAKILLEKFADASETKCESLNKMAKFRLEQIKEVKK